jgi:hypothetical protein
MEKYLNPLSEHRRLVRTSETSLRPACVEMCPLVFSLTINLSLVANVMFGRSRVTLSRAISDRLQEDSRSQNGKLPFRHHQDGIHKCETCENNPRGTADEEKEDADTCCACGCESRSRASYLSIVSSRLKEEFVSSLSARSIGQIYIRPLERRERKREGEGRRTGSGRGERAKLPFSRNTSFRGVPRRLCTV